MPITISGSTGISGVDGTVATPAVQGADTNTGIYYPAADQVALSTNGAQAMLATTAGVTIAGNLSFNSGYGSAAVAYGCRAWVNFNGTGTVAIRASGNVTSITDNGTGEYTLNFTTALPDANYSVVGSCGTGAAGNDDFNLTTNFNATTTTTSTRVGSQRANTGVLTDVAFISVAVFR